MGFVSQLQAEREQELLRRARQHWEFSNKKLLREMPAALGIPSSLLREVLAGRKKTVTLQAERMLADKGCPGFEEYRTGSVTP